MRFEGRYKRKDAYDIYYCIRNYPGGPRSARRDLPTAARAMQAVQTGLQLHRRQVRYPEGFGPTCVRRFVEDTNVLGERSPEQWQQDAFGQVEPGCGHLACDDELDELNKRSSLQTAFKGHGRRKRLGGMDEVVSKIVPNTQPRKIPLVFNDLQHRVISLSNSCASVPNQPTLTVSLMAVTRARRGHREA